MYVQFFLFCFLWYELNQLYWNCKLLFDYCFDSVSHVLFSSLYRLSYCGITDEGCAALTSALRSNPSHLRELDLSGNKLGDSVKLLSDVLQNPHCNLETLK